MATSPDSVTPASAAYQLVRNLESAASGTRSACIINDAFPSTASDIALDCELLVLGSTDGVVTIWRLREDGSVDMVNGFVAHEGTIMDIVGSMHLVPDVDSDAFPCPGMECTALEASMTFYTCGRDHNIHRFSVSGDKIMTFKGHEDVVCSIHEFNSGNNLVSGSWDGSAIIWNCLTGAIQHRLRDSCYKYSVYCNSLPDGTVVTGMTNGDVCFWREGHLDKAVRGHDGVVRAVSVKDGTILSCANDCSVHIYSDALDLILPLPHAHENFIYDIRHSKNYSVFFTSSEDKSVKVWDLMTGQILQSLALETSVWKVIETRHHGIVVIPLNGNVTIWQLIPGTTPVTITSRSEDFGKPCDVETNKRSRAEGSFEMTRFQKANGAKAVERLMAFNESKSSDVVISEKDIALITSIFSAGKISYGLVYKKIMIQ
ncbi:WD domain, G-beta repeat containing protein [Babesia divergens]|uniref:WD domain, G-beta repeat containing protein n=1 Tax=Babesia divergens TaxID=32595 RepID=A0AAD9GHN6_BABDI|nr:WD domain, G-beta repeat containing protein [Babesia divergens]